MNTAETGEVWVVWVTPNEEDPPILHGIHASEEGAQAGREACASLYNTTEAWIEEMNLLP